MPITWDQTQTKGDTYKGDFYFAFISNGALEK